MEDNNKTPKIDDDSIVEITEEENSKVLKILGIVVLVALMLFGTVHMFNKKQSEIKDNNQKVTQTIDNNNKKIQEKVENQEVKQGFQTGVVERPEELKKDFVKSVKPEQKEKFDKVKNTPEEFRFISDDIQKSRTDYYREKTGLDSTITSSTATYSEKDGYTSDYNKKYIDGQVLINDKYTLITSEELERFISHEIEKRTNPIYTGKSGEPESVEFVDIIESSYLPEGSEYELPEYTVEFGHSVLGTNRQFIFRVNEEGGIEWVKE